MGNLKDIADRNRQLRQRDLTKMDPLEAGQSAKISDASRYVNELSEKLKENNGMDSTTSTSSDNENGSDSSRLQNTAEKALEKVEDLKSAKNEKLKAESERAITRQEEITKQENLVYKNTKEEEQRLYEERFKEQQRIEEAKKAEESKEAAEVENQYSRLRKSDQTIKDSKFKYDSNAKVDKVSHSNDKLNTGHSLEKMRGTAKTTEQTAEKTEFARKTAKTSRDIAKKTTEEAAKKTAKAGAKYGTKKAVEAAGTSLGIWGIIAAAILIVVFMVVALIIMFMLLSTASTSSRSGNGATYEQQAIYNALLEHFEGNPVPVLGIMCNIQYESGFKANNLENVNNGNWHISDEDYTDEVNSGAVSKEDFIKSTYNGMTNGYYTAFGAWANRDGGYGFCQYTAYEKKKALYEFAEQWFSDDGEGAGQPFDIADVDMQAHYIVYVLENFYPNLDNQLKACTDDSPIGIEKATFLWLKYYEIPVDPYLNGYITLAGVRAQAADDIYAACMSGGGSSYGGDFEEIDGTYFKHEGSGPCHACAIATVAKRYCYMNDDPNWDSITPECFSDDGRSIHDAIIQHGSDVRVWYVDDSSGTHCATTEVGWSPTETISFSVHGTECNFVTVTVNGPVDDETFINLLESHPEGIVVYCPYVGQHGASNHAKVITRYEDGIFYCIDSVDSSRGIGEVPLSETSCWFSFNNVESYKYISN